MSVGGEGDVGTDRREAEARGEPWAALAKVASRHRELEEAGTGLPTASENTALPVPWFRFPAFRNAEEKFLWLSATQCMAPSAKSLEMLVK